MAAVIRRPATKSTLVELANDTSVTRDQFFGGVVRPLFQMADTILALQ